MDWNYRVIACACGVIVDDYGRWRVDHHTGEAHTCRTRLDVLDDLTAQALAGQDDLDSLVASVVNFMVIDSMLKGSR